MKVMLATAALGVAIFSGGAEAATYAYNVNGTSDEFGQPLTGMITFTTNDVVNASGGSLVTAAAGSFNGDALTTLENPGGYGGNDNLLFPTATIPFDSNGVTFDTSAGRYNFYNNPSYSTTQTRVLGTGLVTLTPVSTAGAVPEPATWAMLIVGMGATGFAMRRRRVTTRVSYAT